MREDIPPAWTTQERLARLTVVIRQNTPIGTFKIHHAGITIGDMADETVSPHKTKQRLYGTQQDHKHKSAGSVWRERM